MDETTRQQIHEAIRTRIANGLSYEQIESDFTAVGYTREQIAAFYAEVACSASGASKNTIAPPNEVNTRAITTGSAVRTIKKVLTIIAIGLVIIVASAIGLTLLFGSEIKITNGVNEIRSEAALYYEKNGSLSEFCAASEVAQALTDIAENTNDFTCEATENSLLIQYVVDNTRTLCRSAMTPAPETRQPIPTAVVCVELPFDVGGMSLSNTDADADDDITPDAADTIIPYRQFVEVSSADYPAINKQYFIANPSPTLRNTSDSIGVREAMRLSEDRIILRVESEYNMDLAHLLFDEQSKWVVREVSFPLLTLYKWYTDTKLVYVGEYAQSIIITDFITGDSTVLYQEEDPDVQLVEVWEMGMSGLLEIEGNEVVFNRYQKLPGTTQAELIEEVRVQVPESLRADNVKTDLNEFIRSETAVPQLLDSLNVAVASVDEYVLLWSVTEDVRERYDTQPNMYISFYLVPAGSEIEYRDEKGIRKSIGDGFLFDTSSYAFSLKPEWNIEPGQEYEVIAELSYQPRDFTCDPQYKKDCAPVYSPSDTSLMEEVKRYTYRSEPIVLRRL